MKIEQLRPEDLKPYENNAKIHTEKQLDRIVASIREFGFNDPIAVDENNMIIEGHGRQIAALRLGLETVPCIRLPGMTEEQKRAYILVHNQLTLNTGFDFNILDAEIAKIQDIDMEAFGFEEPEVTVDDYGTDFELNSSEAPLVRTLSMSLTPEQYKIWMDAIAAKGREADPSAFSDKVNRTCNLVAAIIHDSLHGGILCA